MVEQDTSAATEPKKSSRLAWFAGWVLIPLLVVAVLFFGGVHMGANDPDGWLAKAVLWVAGP